MKTKSFILILVVLLFKTSLPGQVTVLPRGSVVAGLTLEEWSAEWWKWAGSLQCAVHPILDTNGMFAHGGQAGQVFFLAGTFSYGGETNYTTRTITITSDKYLFFPVINWATDNVGRAVPLSPQELRDELVVFGDLIGEATTRIDGMDIQPLRLQSPVFSSTLPEHDNFFQCFGLDFPGGLIDPTVSDGYWVMLAPIPPGAHLLHFRGTVGTPINVGFDVTYHLTVRRPTLSEIVGNLVSSIQRAGLLPNQEGPLLASLTAAQTSFDRNQLRAGIHHLRAFQNQVRAQLSPELARDLISQARTIIDRAKRDLRKASRGEDDDDDDQDNDDHGDDDDDD